MNKLPLLLLPLSLAAFADVPPVRVPAPVFFDEHPGDKIPSSEELAGQDEPAPAAVSDGLSPGSALEERINRAVIRQDWDALTDLLAQYRTRPDRDQILYDYALGALRRSQLRHDEAVALYRGIVLRQPDLAYPSFDLGVMLFENKQYREAAAELERAKPDLQPDMQQLADHYLKAVKDAQSWQPEASLQYEATDNVNSASATEIIEWGGRQWHKTADSLPQSAHGLRYGLGLSREINLGGHHFAYGNLSGDGVHYWDNREFNEQSVNLAAGYKNRSITRSFGIVPFAEQNWLGGSRYNRSFGAHADFSRRLNARWRVMLNAGYVRKHYQDHRMAARYDAGMPLAGATLLYTAPKNWLFYGGTDWSHDITNEAEQASVRKGVRLGMVKFFSDGLGPA